MIETIDIVIVAVTLVGVAVALATGYGMSKWKAVHLLEGKE